MLDGYEVLDLISGGPYVLNDRLDQYLKDNGITARQFSAMGEIDYIHVLNALKGKKQVSHGFVTAALKARIPFDVLKDSLEKVPDQKPEGGELSQIKLK